MKRFFGDYLIAGGRIDQAQLDQALEMCERVNLHIGELAVREGWLDSDQVRRILDEQRSVDRRFGQLAISRGLLNEEQVQSLVHRRTQSHLYIGQALVRLGAMTESEVEEELASYHEEVKSDAHEDRVPLEISSNPVAASILEALPRIASRMAHVQMLTRWEPQWIESPELTLRRWILVDCRGYLAIGFAASDELARRIGGEMHYCDPDELEVEDLSDALGEMLNLIVGSAKLAMKREQRNTHLNPPKLDDFPSTGYALHLDTSHGKGCLVFQSLSGLDDGP